MVALTEVLADLADESAWLDAAVQGLDDAAWNLPTPAPGWTIAHLMATGRLMETWAHGQDIAETLQIPHPVTNRLRHVAHVAVRARDYAFVAHGLTAPADPVYVELTAPDSAIWTGGPADAKQYIQGPALDFCLLATQRCHRSDTDLVATGPDAERWLDIAQAFAGPPGAGRKPRA